jgi:uncharacterized membrane protein YphA (DoxX/SURF4 family)
MLRLQDLSPAKKLLAFVVAPWAQTMALVVAQWDLKQGILVTNNPWFSALVAAALFFFLMGANAMFVAFWILLRHMSEAKAVTDGPRPPLQ